MTSQYSLSFYFVLFINCMGGEVWNCPEFPSCFEVSEHLGCMVQACRFPRWQHIAQKPGSSSPPLFCFPRYLLCFVVLWDTSHYKALASLEFCLYSRLALNLQPPKRIHPVPGPSVAFFLLAVWGQSFRGRLLLRSTLQSVKIIAGKNSWVCRHVCVQFGNGSHDRCCLRVVPGLLMNSFISKL